MGQWPWNAGSILHSTGAGMTVTTMSSHDFKQHVSRARRAAAHVPVIITNHGDPAYVLLRHEDYSKLLANVPSILDLLAMPGTEDIEFDLPKFGTDPFKPADPG